MNVVAGDAGLDFGQFGFTARIHFRHIADIDAFFAGHGIGDRNIGEDAGQFADQQRFGHGAGGFIGTFERSGGAEREFVFSGQPGEERRPGFRLGVADGFIGGADELVGLGQGEVAGDGGGGLKRGFLFDLVKRLDFRFAVGDLAEQGRIVVVEELYGFRRGALCRLGAEIFIGHAGHGGLNRGRDDVTGAVVLEKFFQRGGLDLDRGREVGGGELAGHDLKFLRNHPAEGFKFAGRGDDGGALHLLKLGQQKVLARGGIERFLGKSLSREKTLDEIAVKLFAELTGFIAEKEPEELPDLGVGNLKPGLLGRGEAGQGVEGLVHHPVAHAVVDRNAHENLRREHVVHDLFVQRGISDLAPEDFSGGAAARTSRKGIHNPRPRRQKIGKGDDDDHRDHTEDNPVVTGKKRIHLCDGHYASSPEKNHTFY
ncbi:hypothetical protein SDC9_109427 [bioreactor metagenome]|uniref:Uncharacterized protein n=1 Tax=bioreactor metagenome TaxID=1076179 RepID=A0A645BB57_9ZZZZ